MMKRIVLAAAGFFAASAAPAFAADNLEITVGGVIQPASCAMSVGNGGNFDYGEINATLLAQGGTSARTLEQLTAPFSLECDAAARWALRAVDERAGTGLYSLPYMFGLGLAKGDVKIGDYWMAIEDGQADGVAVTSTFSIDGGSSWRGRANAIDDRVRHDGGLLGFNLASAGTQGPKAIKSFTGTLRLGASVNAVSRFDLSEDVELDGASTLQLYMI